MDKHASTIYCIDLAIKSDFQAMEMTHKILSTTQQ